MKTEEVLLGRPVGLSSQQLSEGNEAKESAIKKKKKKHINRNLGAGEVIDRTPSTGALLRDRRSIHSIKDWISCDSLSALTQL